MTESMDKFLDQIHKDYGTDSAMRMSDSPQVVDVVPSGSIALDYALGVGGYPRGRVTEIYGPESSGKSTLAQHAVAQAQATGGNVGYIDAENALDPIYAAAIGVKVEDLVISQPDDGEQGLNIARDMVKSNLFDLVVVDSVAALTPRAEIAGDIGDASVGAQARMMSQSLRIITHDLKKTNTSIIFINQLREKIGVMFGCFHYNARVVLADGTTETIGKIVNQKMDVEVLSYDESSGKIVPRRIVDWHDNGKAESFLQFEVDKGSKQGVSKFACTANHMIFTPEGERPAGEIREGDMVLGRIPTRNFSDDQWQIVLGSVIGDGSVRCSKYNTSLRISHGPAQRGYSDWKAHALAIPDPREEFSVSSRSLDEFRSLAGLKRAGAEARTLPTSLVDSIDARGVAIWYMDDGSLSGCSEKWGAGKASISVKSLDVGSRNALADRVHALGGGRAHVSDRGTMIWSGENARLFFNMVSPFVMDEMSHKLPTYAKHGEWAVRPVLDFSDQLIPVVVRRIYEKPQTRSMKKFDITVEGNHNYFVDDVLVHNSPETTPGGRALKFYSSVRLDIRRKETLKRGTDAFGIESEVKVVKNKVAAPFKTARMKIHYGVGISYPDELVTLGADLGVITKAGAWFSYEGAQLGQGAANSAEFLADEPAMAKLIETDIRNALWGEDGS